MTVEVVTETRTRTKKDFQPITTSFFDFGLKKKADEMKFARTWAQRNIDHGEVLVASLEVDYTVFDQHILVEDSKELSEKLTRIGFETLTNYPDEEKFDKFTRVMYNRKHNIAFSLYKPAHAKAIKIANEITHRALIDGETGMAVFLASIEVLLEN